MSAAAAPQPHVPAETKGRHKTIAVAAPAWHLRALVRAAVENKRTRVIEAASLKALRGIARDERLDLVIVDADLAVCDTTPLSAQLPCDSALAEAPLLLLTDRAAPDDASSASAFQPDRTLHKHFSPFELLNAVYALTGY